MEKKHLRKHFALYLCFVILNLTFIWGNSFVPGDISGEISGGIFEVVSDLFAVFGDKGQFVLRKLAHFSEFTALGFFLTGLWRNISCREYVAPPLLLGLAAACIDETVQIFSRAGAPALSMSGSTSPVYVWAFCSAVCFGIFSTEKPPEKGLTHSKKQRKDALLRSILALFLSI